MSAIGYQHIQSEIQNTNFEQLNSWGTYSIPLLFVSPLKLQDHISNASEMVTNVYCHYALVKPRDWKTEFARQLRKRQQSEHEFNLKRKKSFSLESLLRSAVCDYMLMS